MMERLFLQVHQCIQAHLLEMLSSILRTKQLCISKHIEDHLHVPVVVREDMLLHSLSEVSIVLVILLEEANLHFTDEHWVGGHQSTGSSQVGDGSDLTKVRLLLWTHFIDAYKVLLLFRVEHTLEFIEDHLLLGINLLLLFPHQYAIQETLLITTFGLLELHFEFILEHVFVWVTNPLLISLLVNFPIKIVCHTFFRLIERFILFDRVRLVIVLLFTNQTFILGYELEVLRNHLISIFFLLMLRQEVPNIALVEVTKVTPLLNNLRKSFNDEVNKLGVIVSHVVLLYDDILWQVNVHFHVLNEELNLRQVVMGGKQS